MYDALSLLLACLQARGRARKRGSKYCWLVRSSSPTAEEEEEEEEEEEAIYQLNQATKPWSILKK